MKTIRTIELSGSTRQELPARFAIGYSQFYRQGPCFEAGRRPRRYISANFCARWERSRCCNNSLTISCNVATILNRT